MKPINNNLIVVRHCCCCYDVLHCGHQPQHTSLWTTPTANGSFPKKCPEHHHQAKFQAKLRNSGMNTRAHRQTDDVHSPNCLIFTLMKTHIDIIIWFWKGFHEPERLREEVFSWLLQFHVKKKDLHCILQLLIKTATHNSHFQGKCGHAAG